MLRQPQVKNYKEPKNFEDANLYQKEEESLPIEHAIGWSIASHGMVGILLTVLPIVLLLLGINLSLFNKLIAHETRGGAIYYDTQSILDSHYSIKRVASTYLFIQKNINFFLFHVIR